MTPSLDTIAATIHGCTLCPLHQGITHYVPGSGNPQAALLFVGEAPGKQEDLHGLPFVGASGKLLNSLLAHIHLQREDVFVANIVKCRPPKNRDPKPAEIATCQHYLEAQITAINPRLIVTLGRHAMRHFLPEATIGDAHGILHHRSRDQRAILPLYHPAAALYNGSLRSVLLEDISKIPTLLPTLSTASPQ